jgi:hypothetical protein
MSRIGACMTSITRPLSPSAMVSARVTAVTFIDDRISRPPASPKSNHRAASGLLV